MPWAVEFYDDFEPEFAAFEPAVLALLAFVKLLADYGPQLGRPYADTLRGSNQMDVKELWFEAPDSDLARSFAFDPQRHLIPDVAGTGPAAATSDFTGSLSQRRTSGFRHTHLDRLKARREEK
jgi:hypothetical protein